MNQRGRGVDMSEMFEMRSLGLLAALVFAGTASGQDPRVVDTTSDDTTSDGEQEDPLAWVGEREILFFARVKGTGAELRSGPDPAYKVLRTAHDAELLIVVGDAARHVRVLVPEGFTAYVHGRYVDLGEEDIGVVNTTRVNIRSRPTSTGDYPIGKIHTGRELKVWGPAETNPDWYRIVAPSELTLFVSDEEIEIAGDPQHNPELLLEIAAARARRGAAFDQRSPEAVARREARERIRQAPSRLERALELFRVEQQQGPEAEFGPASDLLIQVLADTSDPVVAGRAEALRGQIELQKRLNAAEQEKQVLKEELALERAQIREERRRFEEQLEAQAVQQSKLPEVVPGEPGEWIGFLRMQSGGSSHPIGLEQGQQVQAWLYCSSGKLRLRDYAGLQVRVSGRALRMEGAAVVDVDRLTVLRR